MLFMLEIRSRELANLFTGVSLALLQEVYEIGGAELAQCRQRLCAGVNGLVESVLRDPAAVSDWDSMGGRAVVVTQERPAQAWRSVQIRTNG
jgi:hypothetical protein